MGPSGRITRIVLGNTDHPPLLKTSHDWSRVDETLRRHWTIPLPGISDLLSKLPHLASVGVHSPSPRPPLTIPPIKINPLLTSPRTESSYAASYVGSSTAPQFPFPSYTPRFRRACSVSEPSRPPARGHTRRAASVGIPGGLETVYEGRVLQWTPVREESVHAGGDATVSAFCLSFFSLVSSSLYFCWNLMVGHLSCQSVCIFRTYYISVNRACFASSVFRHLDKIGGENSIP